VVSGVRWYDSWAGEPEVVRGPQSGRASEYRATAGLKSLPDSTLAPKTSTVAEGDFG
jgi:hypothetical protein